MLIKWWLKYWKTDFSALKIVYFIFRCENIMKMLKRVSISIMLGVFLLGLLLPTGNGLSDNIICESDIQT